METASSQKNEMGVSRSGRVRKKPPKLMDFQSPDDIETRHKKKQKLVASFGSGTLKSESKKMKFSGISTQDDAGNRSADDALTGVEDLLAAAGVQHDTNFDSDIDTEIDLDDDGLLEDDQELAANEAALNETVKRSIYMTEKQNKKKTLKDGKIVYQKVQRKDKGKSRFTAFMLWAVEIRPQILAQQPNLDSVTLSKRLGERWANLSQQEKLNWKKRAKRLAGRNTKSAQKLKEAAKTAASKTNSPSKFLNKGLTVNTKTRKESVNRNSTISVQQQNQFQQIQLKPHQQPLQMQSNVLDLAAPTNQFLVSSKNNPAITPGTYKVIGIEPLDAAAHLKLLGDNLSIIGERLKEYEGQITVSGSLSVLLDSFLCSLAPLMCLTTQIQGINCSDKNNKHFRESLRKTLDSIAYVMPGL